MQDKPARDDVIRFRCTAEEKKLYEQAALRDGFNSLSAWIQFHLRQIERASRPPGKPKK